LNPLHLPSALALIAQILIYASCQKMHLLKCLVALSVKSLLIFIPKYINQLRKAMVRILKMPLRRKQLRLQTLSILKLLTLRLERMLTWEAIWVHMGALFQIGIFLLKTSLWKLRNLVSLSVLYCILYDSLVLYAQLSHLFQTLT
jgi:hypothetical protein